MERHGDGTDDGEFSSSSSAPKQQKKQNMQILIPSNSKTGTQSISRLSYSKSLLRGTTFPLPPGKWRDRSYRGSMGRARTTGTKRPTLLETNCFIPGWDFMRSALTSGASPQTHLNTFSPCHSALDWSGIYRVVSKTQTSPNGPPRPTLNKVLISRKKGDSCALKKNGPPLRESSWSNIHWLVRKTQTSPNGTHPLSISR